MQIPCVADRQRLLVPARKAKLAEKLLALAYRDQSDSGSNNVVATKQAALESARAKRETVEGNMALAEPDAYPVLEAQWREFKKQENLLEAKVQRLESPGFAADREAEVATILAGLDRLTDLVTKADALPAIGDLLQRGSARLFLRFKEVQQQKRVLNRVASGVLTFGDAPPPIRLYVGPTGCRKIIDPLYSGRILQNHQVVLVIDTDTRNTRSEMSIAATGFEPVTLAL